MFVSDFSEMYIGRPMIVRPRPRILSLPRLHIMTYAHIYYVIFFFLFSNIYSIQIYGSNVKRTVCSIVMSRMAHSPYNTQIRL